MRKILCLIVIIQILSYSTVVAEELSLSADSAVLLDCETLSVLYEKNANEKRPMASTTKIITAITVIENCRTDDIVTVSAYASAVEGSSVWLEDGEKLTVLDLLYAMMLESGNDAATALAEHVGGSVDNFALMMNEMCKRIGACDTNCINPSGLDNEQHYTTAKDLALIACYAMRNQIFSSIVSTKIKKIPWSGKEWGRTLKNHNKLLDTYEGADGIKTGFTSKSGRCLVSTATRNGRRFVAVTLDAPDDWIDHKKMLNYGFECFNNNNCILVSEQKLGEITVEGSRTTTVSYCSLDNYSIIDAENSPIIEYNLPQKLVAPIKKGDILGTITVKFNDFAKKSFNLYAMNEAEKDDTMYFIYECYIKMLRILLNLVR